MKVCGNVKKHTELIANNKFPTTGSKSREGAYTEMCFYKQNLSNLETFLTLWISLEYVVRE